MNLHMPQDQESEAELKNLAAVPYQIISPGNNSPIIGVFQDSMLGCYQFTRENVNFTPREAMNLLMMYNSVNEHELLKYGEKISSFNLLSQIMPPLSLKYNNEKGVDQIVEIKNGEYVGGQMDKGVVGGGTKGLIHRTCNDFGNMAGSNFIDNLQNIVTQYMKSSSFSVGISDLISDKSTQDEIVQIITKKKNDVKNLLQQSQIGIFENNTGKTNEEELETQVNNILNQATSESGKVGLKNLGKNNRFVTMVNAGSKGSDLNISFMVSCLGQQNIDGRRIPYGFENRTLPHFTKFDDSPAARGFVESSYVNGLSPQELFFHAMGGRVGLIDTAVKTSTTGYIQRRLIKGMEDLMVSYDMTVRTNKNKIVQFLYGEDNIDPMKVEAQSIPIVRMSTQEIYGHFALPQETGKSSVLSSILLTNTLKRYNNQMVNMNIYSVKYSEMMIHMRSDIIKNVFNYKDGHIINCPVAFTYIISNIQGQNNINQSSMIDLTPLEAFELIESYYTKLEQMHYTKPTDLFKTLYFYNLSPRYLLLVKRFNLKALVMLLDTIFNNYKRAIVNPGEMVGMIAGQSIGEVSTQMTLNTFHFAGVASKSNVTRGVPRIEEILSLTSTPKNPSLTVYLNQEDALQKDKARSIMHMLEYTKLEVIVKSIEVCFDPDDLNTLIDEDKDMIEQYKTFESMVEKCAGNDLGNEENEKSKWIIRMVMDPEVMLEKNITMDDVNFTLNNIYSNQISCVYSDYNSDKLVFRIRMNEILKSNALKKNKTILNPLDQTDQIFVLKNFQEQLLYNVALRGVSGVDKVILRKITNDVIEQNGMFSKQESWVLDTVGSNLLHVLGVDFIDKSKTFSNDIIEVYNVLGIEAARQIILNELVEVISFDGTYINYHNYIMLVDRMTATHKLISIFRHGINNDNIGPIAKASFEETPEMFLKAARHAELDTLRGVSANIMCGQEGLYGTSSFQVLLDIEEMRKMNETSEYKPVVVDDEIQSFFGIDNSSGDKTCDINNLEIQNNVVTINVTDMGSDNDYNPGF